MALNRTSGKPVNKTNRTVNKTPTAAPKKATNKGSKLLKRIQENKKRVKLGKGIYKDDIDVDFYTPKQGEHTIDIVPFYMGNASPLYRGKPITDEGEPDYVLDIYVHYGEGPAGDQSVICLAQTYEQKCPICEHRAELIKNGETEKAEDLKPKRRTLYNIVSYDSRADEAKGVQVWNVSHFFMEKHLLKLSKQPIRAGRTEVDPFINFPSEGSDGKSIAFEIDSSGEYDSYIGHRFLDRDYELDEAIVESAYQLDQLIQIPEYEDVYRLHWQEDISEEEESLKVPEEDEKPVRGRPLKISRVKKEPEPEPEEEEFEEEVVEEEEDLEPEPEPVRTKRKTRSKPVEEEEVTEEEEVEEEGCPGGGTFGKDNGALDECEECTIFAECFEETEQSKKKEKRKSAGRSSVRNKR